MKYWLCLLSLTKWFEGPDNITGHCLLSLTTWFGGPDNTTGIVCFHWQNGLEVQITRRGVLSIEIVQSLVVQLNDGLPLVVGPW